MKRASLILGLMVLLSLSAAPALAGVLGAGGEIWPISSTDVENRRLCYYIYIYDVVCADVAEDVVIHVPQHAGPASLEDLSHGQEINMIYENGVIARIIVVRVSGM